MSKALQNLSIGDLQKESDRLASLLGPIEAQLADARASLAAVRKELEKRLRPGSQPRMSDHALLRFMERTMGLDVEGLRVRLMTEDVKSAIRMGASTVTVEGIRFKIQDNAIVTVLDKPDRKKMPKDRDDERWAAGVEVEEV